MSGTQTQPDWFDPNMFASGANASPGVDPMNGFGNNPNGTLMDMLGALGVGAGLVGTAVSGGITAPLTLAGLLGYSAATGKAPSMSNALRSLFSGSSSAGGPDRISAGQLDISPNSVSTDPTGGFHDLADITGGGGSGMGDRMSGGSNTADGRKGEENYADGGRVRGHPVIGALAHVMMHHQHPVIGALGHALAAHNAIHGWR